MHEGRLCYNTHEYLISLFRLDENLGFQEAGPLLFAPAAGNVAYDESIPKDSGGDMDRILTRKLDCSRLATLLLQEPGTKRTGVFEFIGDRRTTVRSSFVSKEISQHPPFVLADDGQGELNELGPSLGRGAVGRRDIVEILLAIHKGEVEIPELLWGDTGNLRGG